MNVDLALLSKLTHSPQSVSSLCAYFKCDRRQLQYARKRLQRDHPILSDQRGMWLASSPREYNAVIAVRIKNIRALDEDIKDMEACLHHTWPFYQPTLFQIDEVA